MSLQYAITADTTRVPRPPIAVLIPVYNAADGLQATLAALEADSHGEDFDAVVVDDGSDAPIPDELLRQFSMRYVLLSLSRNAGLSEALNVGLRFILERGYESIARLDTGDLPCNGRLSKQAQYLAEHPDCMVVGSWVDFVQCDGTRLFTYRVPEQHRAIARLMHRRVALVHPAVMYRAALLQQIDLYRRDMVAAEDYELFLRIVRKFHAANVQEVLLQYEVNPLGISSSKRRQQLRNRLFSQFLYFEWTFIESYVGIAQTLVSMLTPRRWMLCLQRRLLYNS
jgi:glycosyltransferase involved in cell wall biosynthesis